MTINMKQSHAKAQRRKGRRKENAVELLCGFLCALVTLREKLFFAVTVIMVHFL